MLSARRAGWPANSNAERLVWPGLAGRQARRPPAQAEPTDTVECRPQERGVDRRLRAQSGARWPGLRCDPPPAARTQRNERTLTRPPFEKHAAMMCALAWSALHSAHRVSPESAAPTMRATTTSFYKGPPQGCRPDRPSSPHPDLSLAPRPTRRPSVSPPPPSPTRPSPTLPCNAPRPPRAPGSPTPSSSPLLSYSLAASR